MPTYHAERVLELLQKDKAPGAIAAEADLASMGLALEVEGLGRCRLPLSEDFVATLIAASEPSPFGHLDQTLFDAEVRNARELPGSRIQLNAAWNKRIDRGLQELKRALGLPKDREVRASLEKLVIYEEGGFFKPHRDTQREPSMWGTLVVVLPFPHQGGDLRVQHGAQERAFESAERSTERRLSFIALYADCVHELKPVTSGTRLALTFSLHGRVSGRPRVERSQQEIENALRAHFESSEVLVLLLDHVYTPQGFGWERLQGVDERRAQRLSALSETIAFSRFLCLADVQEQYSYGGDEVPDAESELEDLVGSQTTMSSWIDTQGQPLRETQESPPAGSVISPVNSTDRRHREVSGEPWNGNEGGTADQWYQQAAMVLVRQDSPLHQRLEAARTHPNLKLVKSRPKR